MITYFGKSNFSGKTLLLIAVLLQALLFTSCNKEDDDDNVKSEKGAVRPIGNVIGPEVSRTIGANGGTISSADGRLSIDIPSGALSVEQKITIQSIENTSEPGVGVAYRLSPHTVMFNRPVAITFSYADEAASTILPELLGIAYQNGEGIWHAVGGADVNTANKTISIETTHFSDWSLIKSLGIEPGEEVIAPGESLTLKVYRYIFDDDLLATLLPDDVEAPIREKQLVDAKIVEQWSLGGPGQINASGNSATYNAPQQIQEPVTVAVSARIKSPRNNLLLLVANITVAKEGLTFRINGGPWMEYPAPMVGMVIDGVGSVTGTPTGTIEQMISIDWETSESNFDGWGEDYPVFVYKEAAHLWNHDYYEANYDMIPSPGYLRIHQIDEVGGYITGSFLLEKSGHYDERLMDYEPYNPFVGTDVIEGFFRVKRHF